MSSCPMLDNPERLREMVTKSGAHSTDFLAPESAEELTAKTEAAAVVRQITANELWRPEDDSVKSRLRKQTIYDLAAKVDRKS